MIKLGDKVQDIVTGLKGIVTAKAEYLNGCVQFFIEPKAKDNSPVKGDYVDISQLKKIDDGVNIKQKNVGGRMPNQPEN